MLHDLCEAAGRTDEGEVIAMNGSTHFPHDVLEEARGPLAMAEPSSRTISEHCHCTFWAASFVPSVALVNLPHRHTSCSCFS